MIKRLLIVILTISTSIASAQRNNASPYSFYGIGYNFSPKTVEHTSMGGIGVAMKEANYLNFINPASNADLRVATYSLGGLTTFLTLKDTKTSQSGNISSLRYIALGFPVGKKSGFSVGLKPASSVGYSLLSDTYDTANNTTERYHLAGKGGTNKIYGSFGMYVFEGLSLGVEASYIFGSVENTILNLRSNVALASKYNSKTTVRGGEYKLGIQYKKNLKNNLQLSTGLAVKLSNNLKQRGTEKLYSLTFNKNIEIPKDTLYLRSVNTNITSPVEAVVGFGLGKENKWYVGVNSEFRNAIKSTAVTRQNNYKYEGGFRTSVGGYYIPKINSISSYWDRVTYRAGFRYDKTGLMVNGNYATSNNFTSINDFGINVGLGLPLPKQMSNLNFGLEYGQRGTTNNNLIKESYFNVRLGLSLNSLNWFKKRKID